MNIENQQEETTAKETKKTKNRTLSIGDVLGNTVSFWEKHSTLISGTVLAIAIVIAGVFLVKKFYIDPRNEHASEEIFAAQHYYQQRDFEKALKGDGKHLGFEQIIDEYSSTKSGNLARFYAGSIYLNKGEYQKAIDYLEDFSSKDMFLGSQSKAMIGDAYWELNNISKAIKLYEEAVAIQPNAMTTPFVLLKLGMAYEVNKDNEKALKSYQKIKTDFPQSFEAREIDKHIARAEML